MSLQTMDDLESVIKPDAARLLTSISRFLTEQDIQSYLVGGFVRDILLGRDTADIDIAIDADVLAIVPVIAAELDGRYVPLDEENGVARVVLLGKGTDPAERKWQIDFTTLKGDIEQDLARRDFTIDAMAIGLDESFITMLGTDRLIDPFGGRDDLRRHKVRAVSDASFESDAARLIRAIRLAAEIGFSIDSHTEALIRHDCRLIANVAGERIREELLRILDIQGAGQWLDYMDRMGILTAMIPEMVPARGVDQPKVHVWDVFDHSIQTVSAVEFLLRDGSWAYTSEEILASVPWSDELSRHFEQEVSSGSTRRSLLKLAALLHDIAKPQTKAIDEDGRAHFLGHPQEGAAAAAAILERLRFSSREVKLVELMIKYHLRPTQMSHEELPTRRAIYRYFRDTGEAGIDILYLSLADHLATRGQYLDLAQWQEHAQMVEYVLNKHTEEESLSVPAKLIDGHDLINIFGLSPGPMIGELLETLREAQAAGEVNTRKDALDYIRNLLSERGEK